MDIALAEGLPEWFTTLMYSGWLYAVVGGIFILVLIGGLYALFVRKEATAPPLERIASLHQFDWLSAACGAPGAQAYILLFAAGSVDELPVTIPVRAALHLAKNRRCLLIDLDAQRNAVARAFEIPLETPAPLPRPTTSGLDNLDLWPAHYWAQFRHLDIKSLLKTVQFEYEVVLLNAPTLIAYPDRDRLVRCAESAVVFAHNRAAARRIRRMLAASACPVLKTILHSGPQKNNPPSA